MPAVPFVMAAAAASGVAATIGTAAAALVGATITGAAATAIGAGVLSAGVSLAQGKSLSDSLKGAVIGGVASFVGAGIASSVTGAVAQAAADAGATSIASSIGNIAGSMAGGAARGAIGAALSGQDPIDALIKGGLTAGLTTGVMEGVNTFTNEIPGFSSLKEDYGDAGVAAQRAITASLAAGVLGKDVGDSVKQSLLGSLAQNAGSYVGKGIQDLSSSLRSSYNETFTAGETLDKNIAEQNRIVEEYNAKLAEAQGKQSELQAAYDKYQTNFDQYNDYSGRVNLMTSDWNAWRETQSQYQQASRGRWIDTATGQATTFAEIKQKFQDEASKYGAEATKYADIVNNGAPALDASKAGLTELESSLNTVKEQYTGLESAFLEKKAALDETLLNYQTQEEKNAQIIKQAFEDTLAAKTLAEEKFGSELTQEQIDALIKTGDPLKAAQDLTKSLDDTYAEYKKSMLDKLGAPDVVEDLKQSGLQEEEFDPSKIDWASMYNKGLSEEEIAKREALMESLTGQDLEVDPDNWDSYNKTLSEIFTDKGGFTSQWQTSGTDKIMINDDGTGIGINTETGETYALDEGQVNSMVKNGQLNTAASGYVAATGGTGDTPGGSGVVGGGGTGGTGGGAGGGSGGAGGTGGSGSAAANKWAKSGGTGAWGSAPNAAKTAAGAVAAGLAAKATGQTNPAVDATVNLANQQQQDQMQQWQNQQAGLMNMTTSNNDVAKIKSYKEIFGEDLFGNNYIPPSALGVASGTALVPQMQEPQNDAENANNDDNGINGLEAFFKGGDVIDVNTLLQILRS